MKNVLKNNFFMKGLKMKKAFSLTCHCSANPSCHCEGGTTEAIQKKVQRTTGLPHSRWSFAMTTSGIFYK